MEKDFFVSICIPSYNRPEELYRLLKSIDCKAEGVEVLVCEDKAPKRDKVRAAVERFKTETDLYVKYVENEVNCGYDRNLRECIKNADGKWMIYMGDDDMFVPDQLDKYIEFLKEQEGSDVSYVLRSYRALHNDGSMEEYKYYSDNKFFDAGFETYEELYRKSVFISGFAFKRELAMENLTDRFDGTLLYQLYILAEICINHKAAYYGTPFTQSIDGGTPYFGNSKSEKELYTPGTITVDNSVAFVKNFFVITEYIDQKYGGNSTQYVKEDMSRYSYPILSIQRKKGRKVFKEYDTRLREIGLDCTKYYKIYFGGLYMFGEKMCDFGIRTIKKVLGKTPKL